VDIVALFITAWNNVVLERFPRTIKFDPDAQPPQVLICDDTKSEIPAVLADELGATLAAA
jgi:hypothetical protein